MTTLPVRFQVQQRLVAVLASHTHIVLPEGYRVVDYTVEAGPDVEGIGPTKVAVLAENGTRVALPWVWDGAGDLVPLECFLIDFLPEAVRLLWMGDTGLTVSRLVNGKGIEFPVPPGVCLPPGQHLVLPDKAPIKVKGTGVVMRAGRVVRDTPPTDEQAAQDRIVEQALAAEQGRPAV